MNIWAFYFFAKLYLHLGQFIDFHLGLNLAFALVLALPLTRTWMRVVRQLLAWPAGAALLYYDSWLPPFSRLLQQTSELASFSSGYLLELVGRFINLQVCLMLLALFALHLLLSLRLRMLTLAVIAMLSLPLLALWPRLGSVAATSTAARSAESAPSEVVDFSDAALNQRLAAFFEKEKLRRVSFPPLPADSPPYDLIFLQICSLGSDDLRVVNLQDAPQLAKFDIQFSAFNTAASYSGPAAIRALRAPCGQQPHDALFAPAAEGCYLLHELKNAGFEPAWAMNHDGTFGNFLKDIEAHGGMNPIRLFYPDLPAVQREFNGSVVQSDYAVLARWWQQRLTNPNPHLALYYNSVSLHDGNRLVDQSALPAQQSFQVRAARLLTDISQFLDLIQKSNRRALVFLLPEHGANVRGDRMQIPGLREIPTPAITLGPVGVAIVGAEVKPAKPVMVSGPTSLLALADLTARLIEHDPFALSEEGLSDIARKLPLTPFVAQNEDNIVMQVGDKVMLRQPGGGWVAYAGARDESAQ